MEAEHHTNNCSIIYYLNESSLGSTSIRNSLDIYIFVMPHKSSDSIMSSSQVLHLSVHSVNRDKIATVFTVYLDTEIP